MILWLEIRLFGEIDFRIILENFNVLNFSCRINHALSDTMTQDEIFILTWGPHGYTEGKFDSIIRYNSDAQCCLDCNWFG